MPCERVTPLVLPLGDSILLLLFLGRTAFGGGTVALEPSEKFLFARKHIASFIAQRTDDLIARLGKPRHAMRRASIFFLVSAFAAPIEDRGAALFPVAHGVPVAGFVGAQALIGTEAGVAPELGNLVKAGINPSGDALPFRIARSNQQDIAAGLDVANEGADAVRGIRGNEGLLGKDVLKLLVIFVGEGEVVRFFDLEAALISLANAAAARAFHAVEQIFFGAGQVGAVGSEVFGFESRGFAVLKSEVRIGDFQMQALEIVPRKLFEGLERGAPRDAGIEIEADIRSRPAGKRTAQNLHAELREREAGEVSAYFARLAQLGQNGLRVLRLGDE